ncbi:hypothetical protein AB7W88_02560 [Providencia vermicola]|nr:MULTISPECIES: hypothetical protein [Morganellaceae]URQ57544.1 Hypothetical protein [Providencia alcalifaciens]EKH6496384.1 hypothetical protein [Providencia rettgeri]ELQ1457909.1 hypothetical protein [Providencia rettgeri]ELR5053881.1 hypothetical protein [Providencia rettgeri]ELR5062301.1 hypothetical protein [Providencia rettgeri]
MSACQFCGQEFGSGFPGEWDERARIFYRDSLRQQFGSCENLMSKQNK